MKKFVLAFLSILISVCAFSQNVVFSVSAKSPALLYKNLGAILNQLPPQAAQAKMICAMSLASIGAPNFEGVSPDSNMAVVMFDDSTNLTAVNCSENSMLYAMIAMNKDMSQKKVDGWILLQPQIFGEITDAKARLAIDVAKRQIPSDIYFVANIKSLSNLVKGEGIENLKLFLNNETDKVEFGISLNPDAIKFDIDMAFLPSGICAQILNSYKKVDDVAEAKFLSSDSVLNCVSAVAYSGDVAKLLEKYSGVSNDKAKLCGRILAATGGTSAMVLDENGSSIAIAKSAVNLDEYIEAIDFMTEIADKYISKLVGSFIPANEINEATPLGTGFKVSDKKSFDLDGTSVKSYKMANSEFLVSSVNGFLITVSNENLDFAKDAMSKTIAQVKSGKAVQNPLPANIDSDVIMTYNLSKIPELDGQSATLFSGFAPLKVKADIKDSKVSMKSQVSVKSILNLVNTMLEMQMKNAMQAQ